MEQHYGHSPEDLNTIIILALDSLLARIELFSFVDVFTTCVTPPVH